MSVDLQPTGYTRLVQKDLQLIDLEGFRHRDASGTFGCSQQTRFVARRLASDI